MRIELHCQFARVFERNNANGPIGSKVDKRGGHLAPVAKLERALAEAAAGDERDGVRGTAIDFNVGDEALAVGAVRIGNAEPAEAEQGHAHAEYLASAQVTVRDLGFAQKLVECFHRFFDANGSCAR